MSAATIHASAVPCGTCGILIRGPSGAGKSRLALALLQTLPVRFVPMTGKRR